MIWIVQSSYVAFRRLTSVASFALALGSAVPASAASKKKYTTLEEAVTDMSQQGMSMDALRLALSRTGSNASPEERFTRADLLEKVGLWQLAQADRVNGVLRSRNVATQISRVGELALVTDRLETLAPIAANLNRSGVAVGSWPVAFRAAIGALYLRLGDLTRASQVMPPGSSLGNLSPASRSRALQYAAALSFARGHYDQALSDLQPVTQINAFNPGQGYLQRARVLFEQRKYGAALEELVNIPRGNPSWYSGVMTSAWSAYHIKDYNLALGQLMSMTSPYLASKYNPEAFILQAATFYRLCHFQSATRSLGVLRNRYKELPSSLSRFKRLLGSRIQGVSVALNYARGNTENVGDMPDEHWAYIMDGILNLETTSEVDRSIMMADQAAETLKSLAARGGNAALRGVVAQYGRDLEAAKREAVRKGNRMIEARVNDMLRETNEALESALAIEVEINTRVRERLILGKVPRMQDIDFDAEIKKGYEFWPYQGEFWRDEAGSYVFATSDVCGGEGA